MKKVFSLVLALVLVLSLGVMSVSAATQVKPGTPEEEKDDKAPGESGLVLKEEDGALIGTKPDVGTLHLGDNAIRYIFSSEGLKDKKGGDLVNYGDQTKKYQFTGSKTTESVSYAVSHETDSGAKSGIPTGINGEELLHIRLHFDDTAKSYILTVTPVANPTVEIFRNVTINVKVVIVAGTKTTETDNKLKAIRYNFTGLAFEPFTVQNRRYTSDDVWKDATGVWKINAASKYPVVDAGAFSKAYGGKLIVDYPDYRVIFPAVKNQDVALNLQAVIKGTSTIALKDTDAILTAQFHDIYVKDKTQIEFKVKADAQNYKGTTLYAYELDANGKPIKAKEVKVIVTDSSTIVVEIPANTRLASVGEAVNAATYGIFATPQEGTGTTTVKDPDTNPTSGPSDSVSVATAFAVISLAAAGFVAVGKAGKK